MNKNIITSIIFILSLLSYNLYGQNVFQVPKYLTFDTDLKTKENLLNSINNLFESIDNNTLDTTLINNDGYTLTTAILNSLKGNEDNIKDSIKNFYKRQLINLYPISTNEYFISIAYIGCKNNELPILKTILNLIAKYNDGNFVFSIPINYLTKTWNTKKIGHTTYYFVDNLNFKNAKVFNQKNISIATKFGLKPENFNFYLCDNYQEILHLLGYEYDLESNGKIRDGYGVVANTIFSVMHNEDFSHDLFHYYSAKIRTNKRNWYAEEGYAYYWGNAYYTKPNGETITLKELVVELQNYLKSSPTISLLELFDKQSNIFTYLSDEISLKKILSSLICKEVERQHGIIGVRELLNSGSGADNFFKSTDKLININRINFDIEVLKLVESFK